MFDALGDRMKRYEQAYRIVLPGRMPVLLRVDGKAFHTWTRNLERPWSELFAAWMDRVAVALCEECQGAQLAYVQSDEISVLLHNYKTHATQSWFDNQLQKMVSVAAACAAATMTHESGRAAKFDARGWVLPEAEVANYFLWRQNDASRNSIQALAQSLYPQSQLTGKCQAELHEMCFAKGHNWNDLPTRQKRGRCLVRETYPASDGVERSRWTVDNEIPRFVGEGREYVERLLAVEAEAPCLAPHSVTSAHCHSANRGHAAGRVEGE